MIYLGNVNRIGVTALAARIHRAILDAGRLAVYLGENGESAAYGHLHREYDRHLRVHAARLVAVYESDPTGGCLATLPVADIEADLAEHLRLIDNCTRNAA